MAPPLLSSPSSYGTTAPTPAAVATPYDPFTIRNISIILTLSILGLSSGAYTLAAGELPGCAVPDPHGSSSTGAESISHSLAALAVIGNSIANLRQILEFYWSHQEKRAGQNSSWGELLIRFSGALPFSLLAFFYLFQIFNRIPAALALSVATYIAAFAEFSLGITHMGDFSRWVKRDCGKHLLRKEINGYDMEDVLHQLKAKITTLTQQEKNAFYDLYHMIFTSSPLLGKSDNEKFSFMLCFLLNKTSKNPALNSLIANTNFFRKINDTFQIANLNQAVTLNFPAFAASFLLIFMLAIVTFSYGWDMWIGLPNLLEDLLGGNGGGETLGFFLAFFGTPGLACFFLLYVHVIRDLLLTFNANFLFNMPKTDWVKFGLFGLGLGGSGALFEALLGCTMGSGAGKPTAVFFAINGLLIKGLLNAPFTYRSVNGIITMSQMIWQKITRTTPEYAIFLPQAKKTPDQVVHEFLRYLNTQLPEGDLTGHEAFNEYNQENGSTVEAPADSIVRRAIDALIECCQVRNTVEPEERSPLLGESSGNDTTTAAADMPHPAPGQLSRRPSALQASSEAPVSEHQDSSSLLPE